MSTQRNSHGATEHALDPAALERGLVETAGILRTFYERLDERRVSAGAPLTEVIRAFEGTLGPHGVGIERALDDVREFVMPHTMGIPHPLYMGLLNSSPLAGGIIAESLIGGLNNNSGSWEQAPAFAAAEREAVRCLAQILGLPTGVSGIVLPGGSYAALHAMQLARESKLPEWRESGPRALSGDPRVYMSDAAHFSAMRAALAVGVARRDVVQVPTTVRGEINVTKLDEIVREDRDRGALPFVVVANLGTTGTGAMDSLPELTLCQKYGLWLHVDACYGGAAALMDELAHRFAGIEEADSVAVDPHKWFFVPMVAGVLFTRHPELELQVFDVDASYIPTGELVDGFRRGLPTSRRSAGFAVWMALRVHGLDGVRASVRRNIALTRMLEEQLRAGGFRVMEGGELSVACARWEPCWALEEELDGIQKHLATAVVDSGEAWFGTVRAQGMIWLRFALVSTFTRENHIERFVETLAREARILDPN